MKQADNHPDQQKIDVTSLSADLAGVTLFRTLGYIVGLPSFIVGTAFFMLGFALADTGRLHIACVLYSLAFVSIAGRPAIRRLKPQNEIQALKIAAFAALAGVLSYGLLLMILTIIGITVL